MRRGGEPIDHIKECKPWEDMDIRGVCREPHEGVRRHKLMTKEVLKEIPPLYSQENVKDPLVRLKYFSPYSGYTLYVTEFDGEDSLFGFVNGPDQCPELGYSSLRELAEADNRGLPLIERDRYFTPKKLSEVRGGESNPKH